MKKEYVGLFFGHQLFIEVPEDNHEDWGDRFERYVEAQKYNAVESYLTSQLNNL